MDRNDMTLNTQQAASLLGITARSLARHASSGVLPCTWGPHGMVFSRAELIANLHRLPKLGRPKKKKDVTDAAP